MSEEAAILDPGAKFAFFKELIPVMIIEYLIIILIFLYYRRCCCKCCRMGGGIGEHTTSYDEATGILSNPTEVTLKAKCQFEDTYESYIPNAKHLLFVTRVVSLGFIFGVSVIDSSIVRGIKQWDHFTVWNALLVSTYFLLATGCSVLGFVYGNKSLSNQCVVKVTNESSTRIVWSSEINRFAHTIRLLFEICGGSAFVIIAFAFIFLDSKFDFWNVSLHFVTALCLTVEMFLNNMYVRFDHFPFNLAWPALFLVFIWPTVYTGMADWPYYFLRTDSPNCFLYYNGLILVYLVFYTAWYGASELKFYVRNKYSQYSTSKCLEEDVVLLLFDMRLLSSHAVL